MLGFIGVRDASKRLVSLPRGMERVAWWGIWWAFSLGLKIVGRIQFNLLKFPCEKIFFKNPFAGQQEQMGAQRSRQCVPSLLSMVCSG